MEDRRNISEATLSMTSVTASEINLESDVTPAEDTEEMGLALSKDDDDEKNIIEDDGAQPKDDTHHHDHHDFHHHHDLCHDDDHHEGPLTWREKLRDFLHTQKFHIAVIVLVVLDCIFVIGELVLDYEALAEAKNCAPEQEPASDNASDHSEASPSERHRRAAEEATPTASEHHAESPTALAAEILHYLSLVILSIFMLELLLKLVALGKKFFHSKLEVFDAVVIIISFILDIITLVFPENFAVVDLIVVLRLWRILRIVNGVILSVEQRAEKKIHHYKRLKARAVHAAMLFDDYSTALEDEIKVLKELLEKKGVTIGDDFFKDKPSRPHFDKKFHMEDENGHHYHHGNHHHGDHHHHHADHAGSNVATTSHHHDTSPPDYDSLHHGNLEASC